MVGKSRKIKQLSQEEQGVDGVEGHNWQHVKTAAEHDAIMMERLLGLEGLYESMCIMVTVNVT